MSFSRVSIPVLSITIIVALLAALLPATAVAAPGGKPREYMVTVQVADSGRYIRPSNKAAKTRIRQRAARVHETTDRIKREYGVAPRHRFDNTATGFSVHMTPAEAAKVAADPSVANVRLARTFRIADEQTPKSVRRVKAWTLDTTPGPDVNANVVVLDTGIGPSKTKSGDRTGEPLPMVSVGGKPVELNIVGGANCWDDPWTSGNETLTKPGFWADTQGHGTHVAGTIGARDNTVGTIGVAPGVNLYSVRVFHGLDGTEASLVCGLKWVSEWNRTHAASADIDIVNMSIEGPRLDQRENCTEVLADPAGDPIQQEICTLTNDGVTVVAAAGNDNIDANKSSPGGFDRVISVGAITDTDGWGWGNGPAPACGGYSSEHDDTFANYSNHGREVDIVAPGTCVLSTSSWDATGDSLVTNTGTSMAAPHVTGAVARYIAEHGAPASTSEMRKIVRAAGRMDWDAKTDPVWYGVNDTDPPNRVLDVAALIGAPLLRTWVYHERLKVGSSSRIRTTRVDVQRGGGYTGQANLSVPGLSSTVASASFGDSTLNGLAPSSLGTNLKLVFKSSASDGIREVAVRSNGSGPGPHDRPLTLIVDYTGPRVTALAPHVRSGMLSISAKGATKAGLQWNVSDQLSSVASAQLQRKIGTGAWRNAGTAGLTSSRVSLKPGQANRFRVKAKDAVGNVKYSSSIPVRMYMRDSKSAKWQKPAGGAWTTKKAPKAYGGSILIAVGSTGSLKTTFQGKAIGVVATVGPARGKIRVRVDGGVWQTIDLKASPAAHRKVVWSRKLASGSHTFELQGQSGLVTFDALAVIP